MVQYSKGGSFLCILYITAAFCVRVTQAAQLKVKDTVYSI
jgi:hypothetical protein